MFRLILRWFKSTWIFECFRMEHQSNSRTSITWLIEFPDPARLRIAVFMFWILPIPSNEPKNDSRRNGSVQTFSELAIISQICQSRRLEGISEFLLTISVDALLWLAVKPFLFMSALIACRFLISCEDDIFRNLFLCCVLLLSKRCFAWCSTTWLANRVSFSYSFESIKSDNELEDVRSRDMLNKSRFSRPL